MRCPIQLIMNIFKRCYCAPSTPSTAPTITYEQYLNFLTEEASLRESLALAEIYPSSEFRLTLTQQKQLAPKAEVESVTYLATASLGEYLLLTTSAERDVPCNVLQIRFVGTPPLCQELTSVS